MRDVSEDDTLKVPCDDGVCRQKVDQMLNLAIINSDCSHTCEITPELKLEDVSDEVSQTNEQFTKISENDNGDNRNMMWWLVQRVGLRIIMLGIMILVFSFVPVADWLESYIESTSKVQLAYMALYYIAGGTAFHALSPTGYLPTVLAGVTFDQLWLAWLVAWVSVTAGAALNLLLVRTCLKPLASLVTDSNREGFAFMTEMIKAKPATTVLLFRCPYLYVGLANYFFALSAIEVKIYLLANAVGFLPGSLLFVLLGMNAKNLFEMVTEGDWSGEKAAVLISLTVITFLCITIGIIVGKRVLAKSRANHEESWA